MAVRGFFVLALLAAVVAAGPAIAQNMGIVTGGPTGTYIKIGGDIQTVSEPSGIDLTVHESKGSIQNVFDVRKRRGVQLGIVQSDVLGYIRDIQPDPELKKIAEKLRLVFPLYNEEVHLLADFSIESPDDLNGKRVAIGAQQSGTYLTAKNIISLLDVRPAEEVLIGGQAALDALRSGEIDAMFFVAGAPAGLFSEQTTADDKFHLVPIEDKSIEGYVPTTIPAGTYPWEDGPVETVAIKATLISFNYRGEHCQNVGKVADIIRENKRWLDSNGHPKWRQVNLNEDLPGWTQYDCAAPDGPSPNTPPDIIIVE